MSFFSRLFRKASLPTAVTVSAPSASTAATSLAKPSAADRALTAAAEERALQTAIDSRDIQAVAQLVVSGASTKIRQAAAHAVEDADVLRQLIREVRGGNDKSVYKVLTAKRDLLVAQARQLETSRAEISAAAAALEHHSQRGYDDSYSATLDQLCTRWEAAAAEADPDLRGSVQNWIDRARETVAEQQSLAEAQAAREQAAAAAAAEARLQRQLALDAAAAIAAEQQRLVDEQQQAQAELQRAEQKFALQIGDLVRKARGALSEGSTARAASVRSAITEKLVGATPLPANLTSQIQQLDKQLEDLKDWKSFSVTPKRTELIEAMESLVDATLDPLALAEQIRRLQDEWRTLSKGAGENLETDWQRFNQAAQKAYLPCKEYFAAQALILEENLRHREALLDQLTVFEAAQNWEQANWRDVINTLRQIKQEWRRCSPVDHRAGRPQQERFVTLTASLKGRLDGEYDRNLKLKTSLIERAQGLLAGEDSRKAIDAIKELQKQWRAVGPVPREADQRLWEEFRQHCDSVFQKRQQESAAYAAELEGNKTRALALCEQVEKMASFEAPERIERATLGELRNAFEALGELPPADARELRQKFERGVERCEAAIKRQLARDAEQVWIDFFEAADQLRAYKLAVTQKRATEEIDTLKAAAETTIAAVQRWPKSGLQALKQGLGDEGSNDLAANEAALKLLCIRAEILADLPTPAEDQALRREYQLQRLVQKMGQGGRADETPMDSLAIEWVAVGPVASAVYQLLLQRFRHCRLHRR